LSTSDSTMPLVKGDEVHAETPPPTPAEPPAPDAPIPDPPKPPKFVPTLTSIARALRSHARAERERERTATNINAAPERPGDDLTPPPPRTSAPKPQPAAGQRPVVPMPAASSLGLPPQRPAVSAQRASARRVSARAVGRAPAPMATAEPQD